jgi:hypothetical protein
MQEQEPEESPPPPQQTIQKKQAEKPIPPNLPKSKLDNLPQNKGKNNMSPMEQQP